MRSQSRTVFKSTLILFAAGTFSIHPALAQNSGKVLFNGIQPTDYIWVSADAAPGGNGSKDHPLSTIQEAVSVAKAGTAIMVKAGEYHENVKLPTNSPSTATAPIWLRSADGPEAAKIVAVSDKVGAVYGYGTDNFIVTGFHIEGGRNGIQFSQSGNKFTNLVENVLVQGNVIQRSDQDGIKISQANNVQIIANTIHSTGQEGVDFVAVNNSAIAFNDVSDSLGAAGIMVKGGSTNVTVRANNVHDIPARDGILVGGWSGPNPACCFVPGFTGYEAKNVAVVDNEVHHVAKHPLNFSAATGVRASHNYLEANAAYFTAISVGEGDPRGPTVVHSADIEITDNIIANKFKIDVTPGSNNNISFHDNSRAGAWDTQTGPAALAALAAAGDVKMPIGLK